MSYYFNNIGYYEKYEADINRLLNEKFFKNKKDILVLSAVIAFHEVTKETIENYKLEKLKVLSNVKFDEYAAIIYAIAITHSEDSGIVIEEKKVIEIFNKYANIGFEKFREILLNSDGIALHNFEALLANPSSFITDVKKEEDYMSEEN